ncbi:hypothetical protein GJ496_002246 [Pomphorhynchus laevis]|nr:hypothetical protein GJ496_002246 [Pomphorhynchus laevis]
MSWFPYNNNCNGNNQNRGNMCNNGMGNNRNGGGRFNNGNCGFNNNGNNGNNPNGGSGFNNGNFNNNGNNGGFNNCNGGNGPNNAPPRPPSMQEFFRNPSKWTNFGNCNNNNRGGCQCNRRNGQPNNNNNSNNNENGGNNICQCDKCKAKRAAGANGNTSADKVRSDDNNRFNQNDKCNCPKCKANRCNERPVICDDPNCRCACHGLRDNKSSKLKTTTKKSDKKYKIPITDSSNTTDSHDTTADTDYCCWNQQRC